MCGGNIRGLCVFPSVRVRVWYAKLRLEQAAEAGSRNTQRGGGGRAVGSGGARGAGRQKAVLRADHAISPEALTDFYTISDNFHRERSAESARAQLDWQCFYRAKKGAMFSRETIWTNAAKMGLEEWYEMYVRPFHSELA